MKFPIITGCLALALLAVSSTASAQNSCNPDTEISATPGGPFLESELPSPDITITLEVGAGNINGGTLMIIPEVDYALDCENGTLLPCADDGNQMSYLGDGTITTTCDNAAGADVTFTTGHPGGSAPNDITFTPSAPIRVFANSTCLINFDVRIDEASDDATPLFVEVAGGYAGACNNGLNAGGNPTAAFVVANPDIEILKEVSVDGGPFEDANNAPFPTGLPGSTAEYRLTVTNTGNEPLANVVINDATLGLMDVPIPDSCLDATFMTFFEPGEECVLDSGTFGFGALGEVDVCDDTGVDYMNTAFVEGEGQQSEAIVEDDDPATVECQLPSLEVTKEGTELAKAGDEVFYTICATNTGEVALENCTYSDTKLGGPFAFPTPAVDGPAVCVEDVPHTIPSDTTEDPYENTATVTCDVVGSSATVDDSADHDVNLIQPSIDVTKTGPDEAKVGDEVCYEIGFTNTSSGDTPDLVNCTGTDTVLGDLECPDRAFDGLATPCEFVSGQPQQFCRIITAEDDDPLENTATITCGIDGFENTVSDSDTHEVDIFEVSAEMSKMCEPDPVDVGDTIEWTITIDNTGEKAIDCTINDAEAGLVDEPLSVPAGGSDSVVASRTVEASDVPLISNTATATCEAVDYDNVIEGLEATADCEVRQEVDEICRTPGFWKNRAGDEDHPRSTDLVEIVIAAAGGSIDICGRDITNTDLNSVNSALEAMCVSIDGFQQRQLARQLTAAALNCIISGGGADCSGTSVEAEFAAANAACTAANAGGGGDLSPHIDAIDAFNNSEHCHERELSDSDVFAGIDPLPGPAGSPKKCTRATKNDVYVVPVP